MGLTIVPHGRVGAEIHGVDLAQGIDDATFDRIRDALHQYSVIVIRDQTLTIPKQRAFAMRFGEPEYRGLFTVPGYTDVVCVSNILDEAGKPIGLIDAGRIWHSDSHFEPKPSMYSLLYAVEVPQDEDGNPLGPTLFVSTADAYDRLSDEQKRRLDGLQGENSIANVYDVLQAKGFATKRGALDPAKNRVAVHPVIRTHPYTGRKCIYVSEGHTSHILNLPREEGRRMIAELQELCIGEDAEVYRHRWAEGDLIIWDNCSAQHFAIGDYAPTQRRLMYRISVAGQETF